MISLLYSLNQEVQQFVKDVLHIDVKSVSVQFTYNEIKNIYDIYDVLDLYEMCMCNLANKEDFIESKKPLK